MNAILTYINDALAELHQVRWPTRQQALRLSAIVLGFIAVSAAVFGIVDVVLSQAVKALLSFAL